MKAIECALISVSDKTGVVAFARQLQARGIKILSTGGTAKLLQQHGIQVTEVSEYTGFPEIMGGRVKTLHPKIHGGILRRETDLAIMQKQAIAPIDLVAVNLYPFEQTVAKPDCDLATAIENIDIGGPTLLRAAAKNHGAVTVVVNPADYERILSEIEAGNGTVSAATRFELALKSFEHTARYEAAIANYLGGAASEENRRMAFPRSYTVQFIKRQEMRYGENPHQQASFYTEHTPPPGSVASAKQLQGKPLSFNNIADTDAALECVKSFQEMPTCVIVKHANPCGVATGKYLHEAYERAYATDPASAFGGIIACNRPLDPATAQSILRQFVEVIIAPEVETAARKILATKPQVRVLTCGEWSSPVANGLDYKRVSGGLLLQDRDSGTVTLDTLSPVTKRAPTPQEFQDLVFAWRVVKFVKSNAIVYARSAQTVGIGGGQTSRVMSSQIAGLKAKEAGLLLHGAVMASDAFFPFRDGLDAAAALGVRAIIQPGGSKRDEEVIAAANEHEMAMIFTGIRHFRH